MSTCNIEAFNLIIKLLEKNYDTHLNIIWATIGLLLATIGWILTSKEAKEYISQDTFVKKITMFSITFMALFHYFLLFKTQFTSNTLIEKLKFLLSDTSEKLIFDGNHIFIYEITISDLIIRSLVTLTLFIVLIILVYRCTAQKAYSDKQNVA